jgi:hypothetical protein
MMQRRTFCFRSSASLVLLAAAPWAVAAKPSRRTPGDVPLAELSFETLADHLNTTFHVHAGEQGLLPLQLIRVEVKVPSPAENPNAPDAEFERFSLVFAGGRSHWLPQESYPFEHPQIGRFELFIVPVLSLDPARHKYEAVFNRPPVI